MNHMAFYFLIDESSFYLRFFIYRRESAVQSQQELATLLPSPSLAPVNYHGEKFSMGQHWRRVFYLYFFQM